MARNKCRHCKASIDWITPKDKPMPVDAVPRPAVEDLDGVFVGYDRDMGRVIGRYVDFNDRGQYTSCVDRTAVTMVWVPHFATCPNARKRRRPAATPAEVSA